MRYVMSSDENKQAFLGAVKREIENDKGTMPLTKNQLFSAIKTSYSPILFSLLWLAQAIVEIFGHKPPLSLISFARTAIFGGMAMDAFKLVVKNFRANRNKKLFEEIVTEVDSLGKIIGMARMDNRLGFK